MSFLTKNNFLEKFSRNVKSSCTCTKISYRSCCKSFNVLSVQWYIKFYDVFFVFFCCFAAARSNATICTTPVTFLWTRSPGTRLAGHVNKIQDGAAKKIFMIFSLSNLSAFVQKKQKISEWIVLLQSLKENPSWNLLCHQNTRENTTDFQSRS